MPIPTKSLPTQHFKRMDAGAFRLGSLLQDIFSLNHIEGLFPIGFPDVPNSPNLSIDQANSPDPTIRKLFYLYLLTISIMHINQWQRITRRYLSDTWIRNESRALATLTQQQSQLPISVEAARAQVKRLKDQSQSVVKKGQSSANL